MPGSKRAGRIKPGPGQESVWDYPRPPRLEAVADELVVVFGGKEIARTSRGYRVLETSHPPTYYIPPQDIADGALVPVSGSSFCEFKGRAAYYDVTAPDSARKAGQAGTSSSTASGASRAAWTYTDPPAAYKPIAGYICFYASRMDACYVGDEKVQAQEGDYYGGWITSKVVGPFKGAPGTWGW